MKKLLLGFTFLVFNSFVFAKPIDAGKLKNESGFIKNEGQIYDQNGQQNSQVLFLFTSPSLCVQLRDNGFSYELRQTEDSGISMLSEPNFDETNFSQKAHRIDIDFVGSNHLIEKIVCEQNEGVIKIHSKQNVNQVIAQRTIKRILYKNVYPQTDIEFLVTEIDGIARFKYNIILHPGADESKLQFLIEGASKNTLTKEGSIAMHTTLGVLEEQVPLSYELTKQGRQGASIGARFRQISERLFGITVDAKNRQNSLVIDPLAWGTYLGSTAGDYIQDICLDTLGNIYVVGQTGSNVDIATTGAYQTVLGGGSDGLIAKYTPAGILVWCTYYGGASNDALNALKVDSEQNILVVGQTRSLAGIATAGTHSNVNAGSEDGVLAKFAPNGNIIWGTYFGGLLTETFWAVYVDSFGDIVVAGNSSSDELTFNYPNIHQSSNAGTNDGLLVKFSTAGLVKWATFYGGPNAELIYGVCTDVVGNIYITGTSNSQSGISTPGAYKTSLTVVNTTDGVMAKFNSLGALKYGTYFGDIGGESIYDIEIDMESNLVLAGQTNSATGIATIGAYDTSLGSTGFYDGFVLKMDTAGAVLWSTYYGGESTDQFYKLSTDAIGNIYALGYTSSATEIASVGAFQAIKGGAVDGLLVVFTKAGTRQVGTYFGGEATDYLRAIAIDKLGNFFLCGYSISAFGIATTNGYDTTIAGSFDGFIVRYDMASPGVLGNNIIGTDQGLCLGEVAALLTGTAPTGGTGTYTYLWTSSSTGAAGAYTPAAGVNNTNSYSPGVLSANTWYKRTVFSGTEVHTSNVVAISVSAKLNAGFVTNKMIQCDRGNNFVFTDTTQAGNPAITRTWDFGNGLYSSNAIDSMSYVFGTENTFVVTLINSLNGACADTASFRIYLIPNPDPVSINGNANVIRGTTETYAVTPSNGSTYSWMYDKGVGFSSTASINIRWTDIGTTELKLLERTGGGCYGDTAYLNITIDKPLGGSELAWDNDLLLYPNPSNGIVYIQDGLNRNLAISVQSILGEQVYEGKAQLDGSIDLSGLNSGIYLIKLSTAEGESFVRRIELLH